MEKLDLVKAASLYLSQLSKDGIEVEACRDFDKVPELAELAGREYQLPTFRVDRVDPTEGRFFWLFMRQDGELIGSAAAQLQELGREKFTDFSARMARHQYPNQSGETLSSVAGLLDEKMSGRLAYIGELALVSSAKGRQKRVGTFLRFLQVLVLLEWGVDWVYAFIPDRHKQVRLDQAYGFTQSLPNAQIWREPIPDKRSSTEWWVGSPAREVEHVLKADLLGADVL